MANYRINSVKDSDPCQSGNRHVDAANIQNSLTNSHEEPIKNLLAMQDQGDNFVLVVGGLSELDWPSAKFVPCPCDSSEHFLHRGPTAVELTNQVRKDAGL